ncbi:MAG: xanthine dehydrogenase family protein subunit M [Candidatus Eisenbacteria bacterium]
MRGNPRTMRLLRPEAVDQALAACARHPDAIALAGGTDIMVAWNMGLLNGRTVVDLSGVRSWSQIRARSGGLSIGALATMTKIQQHPLVLESYPLLAMASATVGAVQIQNRATLGGNLANASPAGDTFPPLAVYEAEIEIASAEGRRTVPILEFFTGVKSTVLAPSEVITGITLRREPRPTRQMFRKVGTRSAQAISKVVAAGRLRLHQDGRVRELRFALGSMAPTVRRLHAAEEVVRGRKLTRKLVESACERLEDDVAPIDDLRSTREYRLEVARNLLRAFLTP